MGKSDLKTVMINVMTVPIKWMVFAIFFGKWDSILVFQREITLVRS